MDEKLTNGGQKLSGCYGVWAGGPGTGDEISFIGTSMGRSTRKSAKPKKPDGRLFGTVKRWNSDRGYGFIKRDDGGSDVFVHIRELERSGFDRLTWGERLSFEVRERDGGKLFADKIEEI